ncbi:MAG: ABC transporter permease [Bacteroidia bacterium]
MRLFLRLFIESFRFAIGSLVENKLRTFLSLLGITIGIFAIISVFTMVDSIRNNIDKSISSLGDDVVYVQKWPWTFGSDYPWWKYMNRPVTSIDELHLIREKSKLTQASAFLIEANVTFKYKSASAENVKISAVTDQYDQIKRFELQEGRYFSESELQAGRGVVVIGANVAENLFGSVNSIGKSVYLRSEQVTVIGIFKKEGQNLIDFGLDNAAIIPLNYARSRVNIRDDEVNPYIAVRAREGVKSSVLMDELTGIMRSLRRIPPREEDNFALNEARLISNGFDQLIGVVNIAGGFIGFFSILVGGFGIANIMFVSVKERTAIIGIQKSLGAKNYFILFQFLFEAVILSIIGGLIGLILIFLLTLALSGGIDFEVALSFKNIVLGLFISGVIGLISGIAPALSASRLNPVDAIRAK